jgi:hypothetical protein
VNAFVLVCIVCDALDHRIVKSRVERNEKEVIGCGSTRMNYGRQEERSNGYHRGRLPLTIAWLENVADGALGQCAMKKKGCINVLCC